LRSKKVSPLLVCRCQPLTWAPPATEDMPKCHAFEASRDALTAVNGYC
jgi:hypothetical protein